eukprot:gene18163-biopygen18947
MPVGLVPFWGGSSPKPHQQPDPPRGWVGTVRNGYAPAHLFDHLDPESERTRKGRLLTCACVRSPTTGSEQFRLAQALQCGSCHRQGLSLKCQATFPKTLPVRAGRISWRASRRANPRLVPRVRPHPPRGPGARRGRMGPEVGPAFQRRSRDTPSSNIGVRLAETVSRHVDSKEMHALWHFGR